MFTPSLGFNYLICSVSGSPTKRLRANELGHHYIDSQSVCFLFHFNTQVSRHPAQSYHIKPDNIRDYNSPTPILTWTHKSPGSSELRDSLMKYLLPYSYNQVKDLLLHTTKSWRLLLEIQVDTCPSGWQISLIEWLLHSPQRVLSMHFEPSVHHYRALGEIGLSFISHYWWPGKAILRVSEKE